jgi:SOS-response transcriptional repressor LexA
MAVKSLSLEQERIINQEEQEVTVKRFFVGPNYGGLKPVNREMEVIYATPDNVEIQGRAVAVIRRLS